MSISYQASWEDPLPRTYSGAGQVGKKDSCGHDKNVTIETLLLEQFPPHTDFLASDIL